MEKCLREIGNLLRKMRGQPRFGSLSRAPLRLLRFEFQGSAVECDWVARPPDDWDSTLPRAVGERNASRQALEDAIAVRTLLFQVFSGVESALLQVYRQLPGGSQELIVRGCVHRAERAPTTVRSLAMRAKLCGFQFWLGEGVLEPLQADGSVVTEHAGIERVCADEAKFS